MSDLSSAAIVQITGERTDGSTWRIDLTPQEWRVMLDCAKFALDGRIWLGKAAEKIGDAVWEKLK